MIFEVSTILFGICIALIQGVVVFIVFMYIIMVVLGRTYKRQAPKPPPYRRITDRENTPEGERITLECGHQILLRLHKRHSLPCNECGRRGE